MRTFLRDGTQPLSSIHGPGEIIKKSVVIDVIYIERELENIIKFLRENTLISWMLSIDIWYAIATAEQPFR